MVPWSFDRRTPRPGDVLIDILYCGVCHSDLHQVRNEWGGTMYPIVPGHEIIGRVAEVGSEVTKWKVGDTVGVGVFVDSCRQCPNCLAGEEQYCDDGMTGTYNAKERDGSGITYGGYSTKITVDQNYVLSIPEGVPLEGAAPLLCAGITTYSPLRHWKVGPGMNVAVVGLGGLGHMGVKFAHAMGAHVTVISHSDKKREDSKRLGADDFINTSEEGAFQKNAKRFDFILNTISANHSYNDYLGLLALNGTMCLVGLPEPTAVAAFPLVGRRRSLAGSMIGGIKETQEMLNFCAEKGLAADVEVISMSYINEAYERMLRSDVRYRFVIDIASLK
ncbi:MAG: alcohol dehydrogenase catalytic domain-containing protein [Armatimonadetes bacterium]|nr:alcohol dehydrogenase catalytic domain-containing protein [Armatimonadota bacterium]MBS1725271.1 NAD(P)-dependent alcohol dehydrogenase [Armatimonadota bacterium]